MPEHVVRNSEEIQALDWGPARERASAHDFLLCKYCAVQIVRGETSGKSILDKMTRLVEAAGFFSIYFENKFVAIKIHFGEPGNLAYIRPNYAARVAQLIRARGGSPFLTDSNTLYKGKRSNAVDHLRSASENGFNFLTTGCDVIIADGLRGTEHREIPIAMKHCKTAKIGSAIADADIVVSMNHFKGQEMTGFGGALKNLGMGSGAVGGKLEMHSESKPQVKREQCVGCGSCWKNCMQNAIRRSMTRPSCPISASRPHSIRLPSTGPVVTS